VHTYVISYREALTPPKTKDKGGCKHCPSKLITPRTVMFKTDLEMGMKTKTSTIENNYRACGFYNPTHYTSFGYIV